MVRNVLLVFLLIIFSSCEQEATQLPIPENKLVPILTDVHLAEAAMQGLYGTAKDSVAEVYYQQIYAIHDITPEQFEETMNLLRKDPERVERLYDRVLDTLSKKEAEQQMQ